MSSSEQARAIGRRVTVARRAAHLEASVVVAAFRRYGIASDVGQLYELERGVADASSKADPRVLEVISRLTGFDVGWLMSGVRGGPT